MSDTETAAEADPLSALAEREGPGVLAVIVGVEGPSYRPLGATMAVWPGRSRLGSLSSGCVEGDIAAHAETALRTGAPLRLRYGRGSPFMDIQLPCGGGLEILLVPEPDRAILSELARRRRARIPVTVAISTETGGMALRDDGETGEAGGTFLIRLRPELRFAVFGKGPEAATFAALARSARFDVTLHSPDDETLEAGRAAGCRTGHLTGPEMPQGFCADDRTAVILFFHDHDWEPPLLAAALETEAFYIGSQGSRKARDARNLMLEAMGVPQVQIARLHGPVGLVPSARDARTLAVSVLAEILSIAGPG